jgi:hypothetical protein
VIERLGVPSFEVHLLVQPVHGGQELAQAASYKPANPSGSIIFKSNINVWNIRCDGFVGERVPE